MSATDPLQPLQACLEAAYEIRSPWPVSDFVVAGAGAGPDEPAERVLVRGHGGKLEIAVCLAPDLLTRLETGRPLAAADFALALEGVSHFLCVVWNAAHTRRVSAVELELQAEIDKFLGLMYFQEEDGDPPGKLHGWLYSDGRLRAGLGESERERYATANRLAARYWLSLLRRYPAGLRDPALGRELRRFYRLPREDKLRRTAQPV